MIDYIDEIVFSLLFLILILAFINILWPRYLITSLKTHNINDDTLGLYYMPKTIFIFSVKTTVLVEIDDNDNGKITSSKVSSQSFKVSQKIVGDYSFPLFLRYNHNPFADEKIKFKINNKGLLEDFKGVSDSKIDDIIFSLSGYENEVLNTKGNFLELNFKRKTKPIRIIEKVFEREFELDSIDLIESNQLIVWDIKVYSDKDIDISEKIDAGFSVSKLKYLTELEEVNYKSSKDNINGLVFRLNIDSKMEIIGNSSTLGSKVIEVSFIDPSSYYNVPIRTTPFAKREHDLIIKDGQLKEHNLKNPSSIVGLASIPIKAGKALMSIPAQLLSIQIGNRKKKHEFNKLELLNQKELLEAEKELLKTKNELSKTKIYFNDFRADAKAEISRLDDIIKELKSKN